MKIISLEKIEQLDTILESESCLVIFKHNTSCPISKMARTNFETDAGLLPEDTPVCFLDLLNHREVSDAIAEKFNVKHESPQLLVIKNGACRFHRSLYDISAKETAEVILAN